MTLNKETMPGIDILNTGFGDFELRFDPDGPEEVEKAKQTITDMLKRGYAIFVRQGKETFRVRKFDADKNASSAEFVGSFRFRKPAEGVIKGHFHRFIRAKSVGSSGHHSDLVVEPLRWTFPFLP